MIIKCEQCETRYKLADELITQSIFKVKCSKCSNVFTVQKPEKIKPLDLPEDAVLPENLAHKIIAISNQKGGVAKTSTAINLAMSLAMQDKRVLLVDFDMQASLTIAMGLNNQAKTFYDLLHKPGATLANVILKTKYPNLWLLPSGPNMALLMKKNINQKHFEKILRNKLEGIRDKIDHIIIDTPPSIEFFTLNALMASDFVIIPTQCEFLSMHGVAHIEEVVNIIKQRQNENIDYKILITMFNQESTATKVIYNKIKTKYQDKIFNTTIDFDTKLQESQIMNIPVAQYDRNCPSALQYQALAQELTGDTP
ncbi:MAG: zinc-ribbon domain-containing protein [Desulfobulbaceae bacterium]|nr:zinc-ribbon domain-containing protein [Desulfobulbaceae bacterium]